MAKYSYESILSAVGRVLDENGAHDLAIREQESGLIVEARHQSSPQPIVFNFGLADLMAIVERTGTTSDEPRYERSYAHDEDTLGHFLQRHELVGAAR